METKTYSAPLMVADGKTLKVKNDVPVNEEKAKKEK
jgi:hypothetical protein